MVGEATDGGCIAAPVVVDDDHDGPVRRGDVVQRLPAHATGERTVADDGNHMPIAVPVEFERLGQPVGVGQRAAGMTRLHPVVLALSARRIPRQPALLAQVVEVRAATRQHLVDVGLVAGVEDDGVVRRVEHPVQGQGQFDDAEVGTEMSAGRSDLVDQEFTNLECEVVQLRLRKVLQIGGSADLFKHPVSLRTPPADRRLKPRRCRAHRRGLRRRSRFRGSAGKPHCC